MERTRVTIWATAAVLALGLAMPAGAAPVDRMVGGGSIGDPNIRVSLGMTLPCTSTNPGANLQINWFNPQPDPPGRESFHLRTVDSAMCNVNMPGQNDGGTHDGEGTGVCKTQGSSAQAEVMWSFTDSALGGPDTVEFAIRSTVPAVQCTFMFMGALDNGNLRMIDNRNS